MANVIEVIIKQSGQGHAITDVNKALGGLSGVASTATGSLGKIGSALGNVATVAGGIIAANLFGKIFEGIGGAVSSVIDLDQQMSNIAATMGIAKNAVGPLKQEILDLALNPDLVVNTTQAAEAIELLAQNGLTMGQIMDGAALSTIAMANATGADFGTAANIATGAMQAFNLEASELGKVADGITGVLVTSKFKAEDYALALANAGEIANSSGVSLEDFNTIIAGTASSFSSGSDAGTSLKTLLQRFANPTDEAAGLMKDLGINVFDSAGNMRDMKDIVGDLHQAFSGMTEQQRAQTAAIIGGQDAARTLLGLAGMTAEEFEALSKQVNKSNQALKSAATRVDSVKGAFDVFAGVIEAVGIQAGDKFLPILRGLTIGFTDMATSVGPKVVEIFGGIADKITELVGSFQKFGAGGLFAALGFEGGALFFKKLSKLFGLITGDAGTLAGTVKDVLGSAFEWLATNIFPTLSTAIQFIIDHFEEIKGAFLGIGAVLAGGVVAGLVAGLFALLTPINLIIAGAALLGAAWAGNWGGIQDKFFAAWAVIQPALQDLWNWLGINIPIAIQIASDFWTNTLWPALQQVGTFIIETVIPAITDLWSWLQVNLPIAIQTLSDFWTNTLQPALVTFGEFVTGTVIPKLIELGNWLQVNLPIAIQTASDFWVTTLQPALIQVGDYMTGTVIPTLSQLWTWLSINLPPTIQFLSDLWTNTLWPAISTVATFLTGTVFPMFADFVATYIDVTSQRLMVLSSTWTDYLLPAITAVWDFAQNTAFPFWESLGNLLSAVVGLAVTALAGLWENVLLPAITKAWKFLSDKLSPIFTTIGAFLSDTFSPVLEDIARIINENVSPAGEKLGGEILPALSKGLETVVKWIKDATGFFNGLATAVKNFQLPDVLTPGSPPPMALALQDIANAANAAGIGMAAFNQQTIDALLGINRGIISVNGAIGQARDVVEKFLEQTIADSKVKRALTIMGQVFRDNSDTILTATDRAAKFRELLSKINFGVNSQQQATIMGNGVNIWLAEFDKNLAKMKVAQQKMFAEAGRTALDIGNRLNDIVSASIDVLDTRVETLQGLIASGLAEVNFEGEIISALEAQELLNIALEEQRAIQDDILQLKQNEQKLGFLEKQLSLVETLTEAGLNIEDILGGMTLGLDASIPDMIAATNKLVQAMIEQVNKDLQLASPSKVMFKKFQQVGAGMVGGLLSMKPMLEKAIGPVIDPLMTMGNDTAGGVTNTKNYYFNQTVNTRAESSTVIGDFRTAQMLLGA